MHHRSLLMACTLLSACLFLSCAAKGPQAGAAGAKNAQGSTTAEKEFDMHAPYVRYHFADPDMDFTFGSVVLGSTSNHGCETGEAFYTAANIKDGDAASWQEQWIKMAERVEARGEKSLAAGHKASAREQLLRASNYYRFGLMAMMPDDPRLLATGAKSRAAMKKAGPLFDPPLEYFEVPFEGTVLPGYFRKAKNDSVPRKTLLMLGGGETFAEDLVFYIMPQAIERGYNFVTLDLPGQGLLPAEGKTFRPEMYHAVKKGVDYALSRKEVDPARLAAFGISGGGGFAPQAAQHDPRIKAVVMNACVVDAHPLFASMTPVVTATPEKVKTFTSFHGNTVKIIAWRWGREHGQRARPCRGQQGLQLRPRQGDRARAVPGRRGRIPGRGDPQAAEALHGRPLQPQQGPGGHAAERGSLQPLRHGKPQPRGSGRVRLA